jgi:UDPglucose--hexose-1-phosphate uridylyltransferase
MSELRKDPIIDRWVIVAAERGRRPTDFHPAIDPPVGAFSPFAPGNESKTPPEVFQIGRPNDARPDTPDWRVRVVPNKFPALSTQGELDFRGQGMYDLMNGIGAHEVVIEHPTIEWDMADASPEEMVDVLRAYVHRIRSLQEDPRFRYVLVFRNKGVAAGATIAHPHSQVIALPIIPKQVKERLEAAQEHYARKKRSIFTDMLRQEIEGGQRIVENDDGFTILSPFAARFPFELQLFPQRHNHDFCDQTEEELRSLGRMLQRALKRVKGALSNPSYNLMLHTCPNLSPQPGRPHFWGTITDDFCWHIDILPRLTSVAGFEWGTGFYINPVAPEAATQFLRDVQLD